jgi:hypothetical protein
MNDEKYFKLLAAEYIDEQGAELFSEMNTLDVPDDAVKRMDAKIFAAINREKAASRRRRFTAWGTLAASFIAAMLIAASTLLNAPRENAPFDATNESIGIATAGAPRDEMLDTAEETNNDREILGAFVLASLTAPDGWRISYVDFDGDVAIYHLESDGGNTVVVLAGEPIYEPRGDEFRQIFINERPAFMRVESSHSILFFDLNGVQFVLSTAHHYEDLIELAEHWNA